MVHKSKQKDQQKACYGTNEWSENSGICCNCESKKACGDLKGKIKKKKLSKK